MKKIFALTVFLCLSLLSFGQKRILFLGNSYTHWNDLPNLFATLSNANNHSVFVDHYSPGGATLRRHLNEPEVNEKIRQGNWDIVILQEQSYAPLVRYWRERSMYPSVRALKDSIRKYNPCTSLMMFMTWGYNDDYFSDMQDSLAFYYSKIANEVQAAIAPVGRAWEQAIVNTGAELHSGDGSHPALSGSYLAACVFYSMVWKESPVGVEYYGGLGDGLAVYLQEVADSTVFHHDSDWNINIDSPQADFQANNMSDLSFEFINNSVGSNPLTYHWDFGDGNNSQEENPTHHYNKTGTYTVTLTTTQTSCNKIDTKSINMTVDNQEQGFQKDNQEQGFQKDNFQLYPNPTRDYLNISSDYFLDNDCTLTIVDILGRKLSIQQSQESQVQSLDLQQLDTGIYFLHIQSKGNNVFFCWVKQ